MFGIESSLHHENIIIFVPLISASIANSFRASIFTHVAPQFLRTSRLDFKSKRAHLRASPFTIFFYSPEGRNRGDICMYVFRLTSRVYQRSSNIPAISRCRELLSRFLIFLMQMRTCGIIMCVFNAILRNITSLIYEWQAKLTVSHNVVRFFFSFCFFL